MQIQDRVKSLKRIAAGKLVPHPLNFRTHDAKQKSSLRAALEQFGFVGVMLVFQQDDGTYMLIDGHLRQDMIDADQKLPCVVLDIDRAEADAILAEYDAIGGMAGIDTEKLDELLSKIEFESDELGKMLIDLADEHRPDQGGSEVDGGEIPKPPDEATTQTGDVWILGRHRLMCGDSTIPDDMDRLVDGQTIHLVNTDPPYNVLVEPASGGAWTDHRPPSWKSQEGLEADGIRKRKAPKTVEQTSVKGRRLQSDFLTDEQFDEKIRGWFSNIERVLMPGGTFYIWGGGYPGDPSIKSNNESFPMILREVGLHFAQTIIWNKGYGVINRKDFMGQHEWCFYGWKKGEAHRFFGANNVTDVWDDKKVSGQQMVHLTEKPITMAAKSIEYSSRKGENVLDIFGGSGSTLMACEQLDRNGFLMEIDPLYCDVIVDRWESFTGGKAERTSVENEK